MNAFHKISRTCLHVLSAVLITAFSVFAIDLSYPVLAQAENVSDVTQVSEFAQSEKAKQQTKVLMEAVQIDVEAAVNSQISIGYPDRVHYLHYSDSGNVANTITNPQDYEWVSPISVDDQLLGRITIWNNEGRREVGNFTPNVEEAALLDSDDDTVLVSDEFSCAYSSMKNDMLSPLNERARGILPEPMRVEHADAAISNEAISVINEMSGGASAQTLQIAAETNVDSDKNLNMLLCVIALTLTVLVTICAFLFRHAHQKRICDDTRLRPNPLLVPCVFLGFVWLRWPDTCGRLR